MFLDILLWVCAGLFVIGLVFVLEQLLSSIFGYILIFLACVYFTTYFWLEGVLVFSVLFCLILILAVRFGISTFK